MSHSAPTEIAQLKHRIRRQAEARRRGQADKDTLSRRIFDRLRTLPEFQQARTVMFYVDRGSEVQTQWQLANAIESGKRVVVPYCHQDELLLFHLDDLDELEIGTYRILEPRRALRSDPAKSVGVSELDFIIVPGVAFDRRGGRIGHGKGYYDKLLENARPDTTLVAIAFECQLFDDVPMQEHDVYMDKLITENAVYACRGR
jgi:5-formyltetrahydrofolate cyclo-ligase